MTIEVDQSGRIEETLKPTVLALANHKQFSLRIAGREKRLLLAMAHRRHPHWGKTLLRVFLFSTLLAILIKDHLNKSDQVVIDIEYFGYEPIIKDRVLALCQKWGRPICPHQLHFRPIGKNSPAHEVAIRTFRGKRKPDREITAKEVVLQL